MSQPLVISQSLSIHSLPVDLIIKVLDYCAVKDILHFSQVCHYYYELLCQVDSRAIWKRLYERDISEYVDPSSFVLILNEEASALSMQDIPFGPANTSSTAVPVITEPSSTDKLSYTYYQGYQQISTQYRMICQTAKLPSCTNYQLIAHYLASRGYEKLLAQREIYHPDTHFCRTVTWHKHLHIIKILPTEKLNDVMMIAIEYGYIDIVERLIELGANNFNQALLSASLNGHLEIFNLLIDVNNPTAAGKPINCQYTITDKPTAIMDIAEALTMASARGHIKIVDRILELRRDNLTPYVFERSFRSAIFRGHRVTAERMLNCGAHDYNAAAMQANFSGNLEMVKWMLQLGANNFQDIIRSAANHKDLPIVKLILDSTIPGVDVYSVMEYAITKENPELRDRMIALVPNKSASLSTNTS